MAIPDDDGGEGLDLNLELDLELFVLGEVVHRDTSGTSVSMHTHTHTHTPSQPVGFGFCRLLDRLLMTTEGLSSAVIDYEAHVIAGLLYIELEDTTRLDP